jgi:adenylate cyclase
MRAGQSRLRRTTRSLIRNHAQLALALDGSDPGVLIHVGTCMGLLGSWREALGYLQRPVDLNPNNALSHLDFALACLHFNNPEEDIVHVDAAVILAPRSYQTYMTLGDKGLAHFLAARYELAPQTTEEALQLYPYMFAL